MKLVVALGGNAIKQAHEAGTAEEQFANCEITAEALAKIVSEFKDGDRLAITHGNGPQSGNLDVQQVAGKEKVPAQPLDVVGAMTQGQIGYMFMNTMEKHLKAHGVDKDVIAVVNQVVVDPADPEFVGDNASKPVGNFFTEEEAKALKAAHPDYVVKHVKPSAEKGWRRTVPSPIPTRQRRGSRHQQDPRRRHHRHRLRRRRDPGHGGRRRQLPGPRGRHRQGPRRRGASPRASAPTPS